MLYADYDPFADQHADTAAVVEHDVDLAASPPLYSNSGHIYSPPITSPTMHPSSGQRIGGSLSFRSIVSNMSAWTLPSYHSTGP
jgi:hypothetical protein